MMAPTHQVIFGAASTGCKRRRRVIVPWHMNRTVANSIRKGTSRANVGEGVQIKSQAPTAPPMTLVSPKRQRMVELFSSSLRYPNNPPKSPGQSATVLVALAILGSRPSQIKTGKVISVPPPAIELIAPAAKAQANRMTAWSRDMWESFELRVTSFELGKSQPAFRTRNSKLETGTRML